MSTKAQPQDERSIGESITAEAVRKHLLYTLSLPERALRSSVGVIGGAVRESAGLLVPQALRDSQTYRVMVQQTLDFLVSDVGGVASSSGQTSAAPRVEQFVARKTVGNFVEMAGMATLHLSPLLVLAVVSDVAYGSQAYLKELADELQKTGVIDEKSSIRNTSDLLAAIGTTAKAASTAFDTPPLSLEGLRETVEQTVTAAQQVNVADALPQAEVTRMWQEMRDLAAAEHLSLLDVSSAMTLHALDKVANVGRGALSSVRLAGKLIDRHVFDYYAAALSDLRTNGYYATLANVSGPYIEGVWQNFSTDRSTFTEELCSGRLIAKSARTVARWLGSSPREENHEDTKTQRNS
jgi:hypothetical protein